MDLLHLLDRELSWEISNLDCAEVPAMFPAYHTVTDMRDIITPSLSLNI